MLKELNNILDELSVKKNEYLVNTEKLEDKTVQAEFAEKQRDVFKIEETEIKKSLASLGYEIETKEKFVKELIIEIQNSSQTLSDIKKNTKKNKLEFKEVKKDIKRSETKNNLLKQKIEDRATRLEKLRLDKLEVEREMFTFIDRVRTIKEDLRDRERIVKRKEKRLNIKIEGIEGHERTLDKYAERIENYSQRIGQPINLTKK